MKEQEPMGTSIWNRWEHPGEVLKLPGTDGNIQEVMETSGEPSAVLIECVVYVSKL
jgi:hypothetical protein